MSEKSFITFGIFNAYPRLLCAFSSRKNGVSNGAYHSLNLGMNCGDKFENVMKNRALFFKQLGITGQQVAAGRQIHSANVRWINKAGVYPDTDALITQSKNLFLTVQTADCFPLLLYQPEHNLTAAVHCGWRGVAAGIIECVLKECRVTMDKMLAVIAPGIQKCCFEVGVEVYQKFAPQYLSSHPQKQKRYLDLQQVIYDKLLQTGFDKRNIYIEEACTSCQAEHYYSYRRDGEQSGRMLAVIGLRK